LEALTVLHLNSYFFTNKIHHTLVSKLNEKGLNQIILIPVEKDAKDTIESSEGAARFIPARIFQKNDRIFWPLKVYKYWKITRKILQKEKVDLIHAHTLFINGSVAYLAKKYFGIPYIVTVRNSDINTYLARFSFLRHLAVKILDEAEYVTTLSRSYFDFHLRKYLKDENIGRLQKKYRLIPNGVHDFWFENLYKNQGIQSEINLLFVGLIADNKNLESVIKTYHELRKQYPSVKLHIVGDGRRYEEFKSRYASDGIVFYGRIKDKNALLSVYRKSHILFVPSLTESFGVVYVEAMTQSLPVIFTKNQGFDGFFEDGLYGFAVSPLNIEEMTQKIATIIGNYDAFSENAYEYSRHFRWETPVENLVNLYLTTKK